MTERSATRHELEAMLRALVPSRPAVSSVDDDKSTLASVGMGAAITGYLWGRLRGRQVRKRQRR